jgi:uncharacterized protein
VGRRLQHFVFTFAVAYSLTHGDFGVDAIVCDSGPAPDIPPLFANLLQTGGLPLPVPFRGRASRAAVTKALCLLGPSCSARPGCRRRTGGMRASRCCSWPAKVSPAGAVAEFAGRYPRAETDILPGAGHLTGIKTDPERYARQVLALLDRTLGCPAMERSGWSAGPA